MLDFWEKDDKMCIKDGCYRGRYKHYEFCYCHHIEIIHVISGEWIKCSACDKYRTRRNMYKRRPALNKYWCSKECFEEEMGSRRPEDFGSKKIATCRIIFEHSHDPDIESDPEALGAEFIEDFVDVHCERLKKEKGKVKSPGGT